MRLPAYPPCGGGPGCPSSGGIFSSATSLFGGSKKIAVAPIIGTTPRVAQQLSDALVAAGSDRGLTIVPAGSKANYTLRGYLIATSEGKGSKITYIWDVNDAGGQRVARVSGEEVAHRTGQGGVLGRMSTARRSAASPARPPPNSPRACRAVAAR